MNTLHDRVTTSASVETTRLDDVPVGRPTVIDRAAMRVGLWLLLWGRRRSQRRAPHEIHARQQLAARVLAEHDRAIAHATMLRQIL
jgi:hypothetical protein